MNNVTQLSLATVKSIFTPTEEKKQYKAVQFKPIPKKTGNVLIDTCNEINSHMVFTGLNLTATKNYATKKGAKHQKPSKIRSACQLRASRLAIA